MTAKTVEFYFDVGSPAAYLAWNQLPQLCQEARAAIDYRPMLLGGVFQATGNQSPMNVPAKGRYMMDDLQRFAQRHGVPFSHNPLLSHQHADADARRHRACRCATEARWCPTWTPCTARSGSMART